LGNTTHVEENGEKKKRKESEKRDRDRCKTTEYVRKNWYVNQRNSNQNMKIPNHVTLKDYLGIGQRKVEEK